ncbi:MAG: hypothetical protein WC372_09910 [Candidatus Neomarinimicrobiota bacterium]|jgi:hypothetical protein
MPSFPLQSLYGLPLETVQGWIRASANFHAFSSSDTIYVYERIGGPELAAGDGWAVVGWKEKEHLYRRTGVGPGLANFDADRTVAVHFVKAVAVATQDQVIGLINQIGAIVQEIIDNPDAVILSAIRLVSVGIDEATDPILLGAELELEFV